jgi:hypothetical protein
MFGERRTLLMGAGAVALLVAAIWTMRPSTPVSPAPGAIPAARQPGTAAQGAPAPVAPVKLDTLTASRAEPSEADRNPFRYRSRVVAPPPRPVSTEPSEAAEMPRPAPPSGPPPTPPIPLKFIGLLERANGVKWAVLSDGKVVMHGREGDIVDGRYRIVKIGTESIELTHADGRGRQVVRLTGQ